MSAIDKIKTCSDAIFADLVACRRHLHAHPELSYHEYETSKYIQSMLSNWGIEYQDGWANTGILAEVKGKNADSKTIFLRADIDALPIEEKNEVPYKSRNNGVMHACGHDVHTSCLLGAIRILDQVKNNFEGTVKAIFQPAEEKLPGGASILIEEGLFEKVGRVPILGQHVHPPLKVGKVGFHPGPYMASADEIYMSIIGRGGHAALPDNCIDPIAISAQILNALQQVVSRNANPKTPTVLSFGKINSVGGATNVIPEEVRLEGTFRTFDEAWRAEAHQRIVKMAMQTAEAMGAKCEIEIRKGYPVLVNDQELHDKNRSAAIEYLGAENVVDLPMRTTAEDFAYYSHLLPANFYRLGTGNIEKGITSPVHSPTFDIDENALKIGSGLMAWLAFDTLSN